MPFKKGQAAHNFQDLTGKKFNMLKVITIEKRENGKIYWKCKCDCGEEKVLDSCAIKKNKSCGCLRRIERYKDLVGYENEDIIVVSFSHKRKGSTYWNCSCKHCGKISAKESANIKNGLATCKCIHNKRIGESKRKMGRDTEIYSKWCGMKTRCYNNRERCFVDYGGRGITVCDEWLNDFESFYDWSIQNGWEKGYSIERKDVDGNYCPENCCWIPLREQAINKRNTIYVELNGEVKRLKEWCEIYGLNYKTVYNRINQCNMTPQEALMYKRK